MQLLVTAIVISSSSSAAVAMPATKAAQISAHIVANESAAPQQPSSPSNENLSKLSSSRLSTSILANAPLERSESTQSTAANNATRAITTDPKKPLWQKLLPSFSNVKSSVISNATVVTAPPILAATDRFTTKDFKVPFTWNPGVTHQFQALLSFGKLPLIGAKGGNDNALTSHWSHKGHGIGHFEHYNHQDTDAEHLTNVDINESAYDEVNREQMEVFRQDQQYENMVDDSLKAKWHHWLKSPVSVWQKVQKIGVDAIGLGPLYGTGQYSEHKHHGVAH